MIFDYYGDKGNFLVIADAWHPFWKAIIDDEILPVIKANEIFKGVKLPPGQGTVTLYFDTSDYLNATRKTSYVKTGLFWDHDINYFSSKLEFEHFAQISEVIENRLSRNIYLFQLFFPLNNGIFININYEKEDYIGENQTDAASITLAVEWKGILK